MTQNLINTKWQGDDYLYTITEVINNIAILVCPEDKQLIPVAELKNCHFQVADKPKTETLTLMGGKSLAQIECERMYSRKRRR